MNNLHKNSPFFQFPSYSRAVNVGQTLTLPKENVDRLGFSEAVSREHGLGRKNAKKNNKTVWPLRETL
jgi:hypothetical protein